MGTNLSVANDRESSPDPWWQNSRPTSANVDTSTIVIKSTDTSSEERRTHDEVAITVAAAVAGSSELATATKLIDVENIEQEQNGYQEDETIFENGIRHEENQKKLELFKQELASKREARQKAIAALTDKLKQLQQQVKTEENARISAESEVTRLKELLAEGGLKEELENERSKVKNLEIELENERKLRVELEKDKEDVQEKEQQIRALKEVASIGKEMLRIRELQVNELKKKLCETQYPEDLREEYEAQIQNVRRLKTLYEERAEAVRIEHQREIEREMARIQVLETKISELERERKEGEVMREHLKGRVLKLDQELEERNDSAMALQEQLDASVIECRDLASQMSLINNLFSQMLVGNLNLERITRLVEENQSLVIDLTSDDKKNDLAALLIDIAKQLDDDNPTSDPMEIQNNNEEQQQNIVDSNINNNTIMSQQDVALNLSKVWRILVQLLTQDQGSPASQVSECDSESCYKSVETPSGRRSVISVSQTFLTLKNLILEKNSLIKEVNKLKLLNEHLETRLGSQEKRLSTVSTELKKTWGVVSKLRVQHKQLHTQEKILKYELQHKRLLLNDLKDELERCKEIWDMARQKNCQSEEEWRKLRKEFADRRKNADINNSAESGYEDDESNTPPTEDSIDEQELDRLIDPENDSFLLMNEELSGSSGVFINDINNTGDCLEDQQNDSDTTIEFLDTNLNVSTVGSIVPTETIVNDQRSSSKPVDHNSAELLNRVIPKEGISTDNCEVPESEIPEANGETLVEESRKSETARSLVPKDTTAENISRFLEGLLAPDDNCQYATNITRKDKQDASSDEKSGSSDVDSSTIGKSLADDSCGTDNLSRTENLDINSNCDSNDNSIPNVDTCLSVSSDLIDDSEVERSSLLLSAQKDEPLPDSKSESNILESKCKTYGLNSEIVLDSTNLPSDCCQNYEESGKYDEACGYSPTDFSEKSTSEDLPSVQEVLGRLCTNTDLSATSHVTTAQSGRKTGDNRTTEEVLDARTERLKRLEEQCKSLFNKVTATTIKSNVLSSRLELLHEQYGRSTESFDDITTSTTSSTNRNNENDEHYIDDKTDVKR